MRHAQHPNHERRRYRRVRLAGPVAAAVLAVGLLAAACSEGSSGPGVAGAGSSSTPSPAASGDGRDDLLAYSQCMRDHGISDFPDPDPNGGISINGERGSDLDPNNPRYQEADEACKSLLPPPPTQEQQDQAHAEMLEYAKCMREHGFPDFPDPNPNGGIDIDADEHPELNPNNPRYQSADKACGGGGGDTQSSDGGAP